MNAAFADVVASLKAIYDDEDATLFDEMVDDFIAEVIGDKFQFAGGEVVMKRLFIQLKEAKTMEEKVKKELEDKARDADDENQEIAEAAKAGKDEVGYSDLGYDGFKALVLFQRRNDAGTQSGLFSAFAAVVSPCGCQDPAGGCVPSCAFNHPLAHGVE